MDNATDAQVVESEEDYIRNMEARTDVTFFKTNDMTYEITGKTFTKTSRLPFQDRRLDGTPFVWARSWNHERITNEANALKIVTKETKIPVPELLSSGTHSDGRRYLVTNFIEGVTLDQLLGRGCSRPEGQKHTDGTQCKECSDKAYLNALKFIQETVLPQLTKLKSNNRGIDGFVMPPSWLSPDTQPPWKKITSWKTHPLKENEYVFQHGDMAPHNLIMDPQTLKVQALIDWEYAGYFPPNMERWTGTLDSDVYHEHGNHPASAISKFLPKDYLECYNNWPNKAELVTLIELGELPDLGQVNGS